MLSNFAHDSRHCRPAAACPHNVSTAQNVVFTSLHVTHVRQRSSVACPSARSARAWGRMDPCCAMQGHHASNAQHSMAERAIGSGTTTAPMQCSVASDEAPIASSSPAVTAAAMLVAGLGAMLSTPGAVHAASKDQQAKIEALRQQGVHPDADATAAVSSVIAEHNSGGEGTTTPASSSNSKSSREQAGSKGAKDASKSSEGRKLKQRCKPRELAGLLGVSEAAAQLLADREPLVLTHPLSRLRESLSALAAALKVSPGDAAALAVRQPRVLLVPRADAAPRLKHLAALLKVPQDRAVALVREQPGLVCHQPEILETRLEALCDNLGLRPARERGTPLTGQALALAAGMVVREPGLLALRAAAVVDRLQGVAKALGSPDDLGPAADLALAAPTALLLPPHTIETRVAALATLLTLPEHAAGELVVTAPRLLTQSTENLASNLRSLAASLGVARDAAAVMGAEQPALLTYNQAELETRLKTLAEVLGVGVDKARSVCAAKPGLLVKDMQQVKAAIAAARKRGELPS